MKRQQCPACGAERYFGGRCAECLYQPFTEEIAHGNHYHKGEPLILRQGSAPQDPDCPQFPGPRTSRMPKGLPVVLAVAGTVILFCLAPPLGILAAAALLGRKKRRH